MALGGGKFVSQNKVLPGAYINFASPSAIVESIADRGVAAMPIDIDWGISGEVFKVEAEEFQNDCFKIFGYDYGHEKMKGLRDLFRNARTAYFYRPGGGTAAFCEYATAKFPGMRGNDIRIVIQKNVDDETKYDVSTYVGTKKVDMQRVKTMAELVPNDFVGFKPDATITEVAGVNLASGANKSDITVADYQAFLDKIETYAFNTLGCVTTSDDVRGLFAAFTQRMRDEVGVKFQTVLYRCGAPDHEGVINLENEVTDADASEASLVYWLTGAEAACDINRTITNKAYDGEFAVKVDYTQTQLETGIAAGKFMFHNVGNEARVLADINSFTSFAEDKTADFAQNQTIRVIDDIAITTAALFNNNYLGAIPNNASGRISLWNDIVKRHKELFAGGAIEDFNADNIKVLPGNDKKSVVINESITVANAMAQLYMSVVVSA